MSLDFQETGERVGSQEVPRFVHQSLGKAMGESFESVFNSANVGQEGFQKILSGISPGEYSKRRLVERGIAFVKRASGGLKDNEVRTFMWIQDGKVRRIATLEHRVMNDKGDASPVSVIEVIDLSKYHLEDETCEVLEILFRNEKGEYKKMTDYLPPGVRLRLWPNSKENGKYLNNNLFYPLLRKPENVLLKLHEGTHAWQKPEGENISEEDAWSLLRIYQRARGGGVELKPEDYAVLAGLPKIERGAWAGAIRTFRQWRKEGFDLYPGITDIELVQYADINLCTYQKFYGKMDERVRFTRSALK
jgi:hypothetical protein